MLGTKYCVTLQFVNLILCPDADASVPGQTTAAHCSAWSYAQILMHVITWIGCNTEHSTWLEVPADFTPWSQFQLLGKNSETRHWSKRKESRKTKKLIFNIAQIQRCCILWVKLILHTYKTYYNKFKIRRNTARQGAREENPRNVPKTETASVIKRREKRKEARNPSRMRQRWNEQNKNVHVSSKYSLMARKEQAWYNW